MAEVKAESAVERAVRELRELIHHSELLPGEHIRQTQLAEVLGLSRVPVREALKVLSTEGSVVYRPNQGYFVAKMSAEEISQLYLMRSLLEGELIRTLQWPDAAELAQIRELNAQMEQAANAGDLQTSILRNREFHFRIFGLSPLHLIHREVQRLWSLSESYRALYHYNRHSSGTIQEEHGQIIDALRRRDSKACAFWMDRHREHATDYIRGILTDRSGGSGVPAEASPPTPSDPQGAARC